MLRFRARQALQIENDALRVTVLRGGGHIAEILDKRTGVNPLWIPPWPSIDPAEYVPELYPGYGLNNESKLLAGIMGHNLCLDTFGPPSDEQVRLGISVHGEASIARYDGEVHEGQLHVCSHLRLSELRVRRIIRLCDDQTVHVHETIENLSATSRPIAWTQHVSIGPPFLVPGGMRIQMCAEQSRVFEAAGFDAGGLPRGVDFKWPNAPSIKQGTSDLSVFARAGRSASFTAHLMDRSVETASFVAFSPALKLVFGYKWNRKDFPWLGLWEEDRSRTGAPWNGETVACGLEFGVSPFPETKEQMIERGRLFDVPTYRTLGSHEQVTVNYSMFIRPAHEPPQPGKDTL